MAAFASLIQAHPRHEFATQYAPVGDGWNTTIGFFNYFSQVFRGHDIEADVHMAFFDADGNEQGALSVPVAPLTGVQIDLRERGIRSNGLVALAAVPRADLDKLAGETMKLRRSIGTGFYVQWSHGGHADVMHEWNPVSRKPLPSTMQYAGFRGHPNLDGCGLVLMNPVFSGHGAGNGAAVARPIIELVDARGAVRASAQAAPLPPMASRLFELAQLEGFDAQVRDAGRAVVRIRGDNLTGSFSVERHRSGDFHIHHI